MGELQKRLITSGVGRVNEAVNYHERRIYLSFLEFVRNSKADPVMNQVNELIAAGNITDAIALVNAESMVIGNAKVSALTETAANSVEDLSAIAVLQNPTMRVFYDPTAPRLTQTMQEMRSQFITSFTETQRAAIITALTDALQLGMSNTDIATRFKSAIGLNERQVMAVNNYRHVLQSGNTEEALSRSLRDRRFDPSVRSGRELTADQISRMVVNYGQRQLTYRASNFARFSAVSAVSQGMDEGLHQAIYQGGIDAGSVERVWNTFDDGKVRHQHYPMDGQVTGVDEPFIDGEGNQLMYPGDPKAPVSTTAHCRCAVSFRVRAQ